MDECEGVFVIGVEDWGGMLGGGGAEGVDECDCVRETGREVG